MIVRAAVVADAQALAAIYGHHVLHGTGTFEEAPPSADEMASRLEAVRSRGLPYVVAEIEGLVAALAYAAPFRLRAAYAHTVEDIVYVAPDRLGQGVGKAVLGAVIEACEALDLRQMVAMIGGVDNAGSIGAHRACGFKPAGMLANVGFKGGKWVDVVMMQRQLNKGGDSAPGGPGLNLAGG